MKIYKIIKKFFFILNNTWENFIKEIFGMDNFTKKTHKMEINKTKIY